FPAERDGRMSETAPHVPVMPVECLEWLAAAPGKLVIDGTFGAGGHSRLLLEAGCDVLAIDQDPAARATADALQEEYGADRFRFQSGNFRQLEPLLASAWGERKADGLLLDIGVSSMQIDQAERGFAFRQDGPLDMRMSSSGQSA